MPSTYSSLLRFELIATGEQSATWGATTNTNLGTLIEKSIAGTASVSVTSGNATLTTLNGADDTGRCMIIAVTGTPGVSRNVVAPSSSKVYAVINGSDAAIVFKGAATTGVTLQSGQRAWVAWTGSDFVIIGTPTDSPTFTGPVTSSGATALNGGATAGGTLAATSYVWRAISATGDRLRVASLAAGDGALIDVADAGETTTARKLTLGAANGTIEIPGTFTKNGHITRFESAEQTCPTTGNVTTVVTHGGSRTPDSVLVVLRCKTAELNYSPGMEVVLNHNDPDAGASNRVLTVYTSAAQVVTHWASPSNLAPAVRNPSDAQAYTVTPANWRLVFKCLWF